MWRTSQDQAPNFIGLLYGEGENEEDEEAMDMEEEEELESPPYEEHTGCSENSRPVTPQGEDLKSPAYEEQKGCSEIYELMTIQEDPIRDRSPLRPTSLNPWDDSISFPLESTEKPFASIIDCDVQIRLYDEDLNEIGGNSADVEFLAPDSHALYVSPEAVRDYQRNRLRGSPRSRPRGSLRGGRRGRRGVRGLSASQRGRRVCHQWLVGDPLHEIWISDEDVPPELISLAKDVVRKRQMNEQDAARKEREEASNSEDEDDSSDGVDCLLSPEDLDHQFTWSPMDSFKGEEEQFKPKQTGSVEVYKSAYDAFRSYWGDDIINRIVTDTNLHASKIDSSTFQGDWYPTNSHEILCLFAFWMMIAIIKMPTLTSCFSSDPLLETTVFKRIFTRKRYEMLTRALDFEDFNPAVNKLNPTNTSVTSCSDQLQRLRPIIEYLNSKFQKNYVLEKNICIDESLTLWKGKLGFKQYIPSKAAKYGIKTFELCESVTGYLWSFIVYEGKRSSTDCTEPDVLKSTSIVKKLMSPLLNKGYRLFLDNWFNSPHLARFLKRNGTDCVGTLRSSRKDVPLIVQQAPLNRGEYIGRHSGDVTVLAWQDKKRVTMISTCHDTSIAMPTVPSRETARRVPFKPQVVLDYNKYMGGVDSKDQMLEPYLLERKRCSRWQMKLFKRLLNVSIINARVLLRSSTGQRQHHLAFRLQLVDSILTNHLSHCPLNRSRTAATNRAKHLLPGRFIVSKHWPVTMTADDGYYATQKSARKLCAACRKKKTTFTCESCRVPLCIRKCFKSYHTAPLSYSSKLSMN